MILVEVVSQHREEAAFLWLLRSNAIGQPHYTYTLEDFAELDDRVEGICKTKDQAAFLDVFQTQL